MSVLGIDPGTRKCGFAVVDTVGGPPLEFGIVPTEGLLARVGGLIARFGPETIALGAGTNAGPVERILAPLGLPVRRVDETSTTLLARRRYFADNPPRGWRRLIPSGMLVEPRPIDDYAAVLIAERLLETAGGDHRSRP